MKTASVNTDIKTVDYVLDYFAESEGDYREIVTAQPQHRYSDKQTRNSGKNSAGNYYENKSQRFKGDSVLKRSGGNDPAERSDAHKAGVTEA